MPLKLVERVLPWLVGSISEEEARSFLQNMHLAGFFSIHLYIIIRKSFFWAKLGKQRLLDPYLSYSCHTTFIKLHSCNRSGLFICKSGWLYHKSKQLYDIDASEGLVGITNGWLRLKISPKTNDLVHTGNRRKSFDFYT